MAVRTFGGARFQLDGRGEQKKNWIASGGDVVVGCCTLRTLAPTASQKRAAHPLDWPPARPQLPTAHHQTHAAALDRKCSSLIEGRQAKSWDPLLAGPRV